jgi:hypothetical protein
VKRVFAPVFDLAADDATIVVAPLANRAVSQARPGKALNVKFGAPLVLVAFCHQKALIG